jgi:hypothetical protein
MKMTITKTLTAGIAAAALAGATIAAPTKADAYPVWVIPAIIGGAVGGVAIGAAVTAPRAYAYEPAPGGAVYVQPSAECYIVREQSPSGVWRRVRVCD